MGGALTVIEDPLQSCFFDSLSTNQIFHTKEGGSIPFKSASEFIVLSFIEISYCTTILILDNIYRYIPSGNLYSLVTSSR